MMDLQYTKNIKRGSKVEIITDKYKLARGIVDIVISRSSFQPKGVQVRLKTGEIGRIQKIISQETEDKNKLLELIKNGENEHLEFKAEALWSLGKTEQEIKESKSLDLHAFRHKASKVILARSIASFLNSDGGVLVIGVKEKKNEKGELEILGIEHEIEKLKDKGKDGYKRMLIDEIIRQYFPSKVYNNLSSYVSIDFQEINNKLLCLLKIKKSDSKVFLELAGKKVFMLRTETESRILEGEELVDYCEKRFG